VTALADMLPARDRERLAARLAELRQTAQLTIERSQQRPAPVPPALDDLAARESQQ
jgi:hypothetical protein